MQTADIFRTLRLQEVFDMLEDIKIMYRLIFHVRGLGNMHGYICVTTRKKGDAGLKGNEIRGSCHNPMLMNGTCRFNKQLTVAIRSHACFREFRFRQFVRVK